MPGLQTAVWSSGEDISQHQAEELSVKGLDLTQWSQAPPRPLRQTAPGEGFCSPRSQGMRLRGVPADEEEGVLGNPHGNSVIAQSGLEAPPRLRAADRVLAGWGAGPPLRVSHCGEWGGLPRFPAPLCLRGQQLGLGAAQVAV